MTKDKAAAVKPPKTVKPKKTKEKKPTDKLADKIAAINQAEIYEDSLMPYFHVLMLMGMQTSSAFMFSGCSDDDKVASTAIYDSSDKIS